MGGPGTNKNLAQAIGEHKVVPQSVSGTSKPKGQRVEEAIIQVTDRSEFLCVWMTRYYYNPYQKHCQGFALNIASS